MGDVAATDLDDETLRPALELAFVVAVVGSRQRPPLPVPAAIKPYQRFQKLPSAALGPVRRAVDDDLEFRERVALVAEESLVGRVGRLWLTRPEGWEDEVAGLAADQAAASEAKEAERQERSAVKRLDAAEQAARRATAELAAVRAELAGEHRRRTEAEHEAARLDRKVTSLSEELGGLRQRVARLQPAQGALDEARRALVERDERIASLVEQLREARLDATGLPAPAGASVVAVAAPEPVAPAETVPPVAPPAVDLAGLGGALAGAAAAMHDVATSLAAAAHALESRPVPTPVAPRSSSAPSSAEAAGARTTRRGRRRPSPLPGGLLAGSVEAAYHLVRVPGILVVVDGYNAAKLGWPDRPLDEQRVRLLDALDELVMRSGCDLTVVFDGADVAGAPSGRRLQRVLFSPPGVSADDVIVELVQATPSERPVLVVTTDQEIRRAVAADGANVVTSAQMLGAVGRRA
jgi:predicted RNA-binding protein with PIN domain